MYERNWNPLGYFDEKHRNIRFEEGKELLKDYYDENKTPKVKPVGIEKGFNVYIGGIRFYGKIDRIDPVNGGGVEIIDYKTGATKTQKDVDKDDQVSFYAIGVKEALKLEPKKMSLYFVESGQKISTTRTVKQLKDKKEEVIEIVNEMKTGDFTAQPGMQCTWCDYKDICPFAYKK
jgi:putative RecB family exonuclease